MVAKSGGGRPSIFRDKKGGSRFQGVLTPAGSRRFELARVRLAKLVSRDPEQVSDADVVEFLARGDKDSKAYLGM